MTDQWRNDEPKFGQFAKIKRMGGNEWFAVCATNAKGELVWTGGIQFPIQNTEWQPIETTPENIRLRERIAQLSKCRICGAEEGAAHDKTCAAVENARLRFRFSKLQEFMANLANELDELLPSTVGRSIREFLKRDHCGEINHG